MQETEMPLTISGFGLTYNVSNLDRDWHYPSHLQVATIWYQKPTKCFKRRQEAAIKFKGHFCAGVGDKSDRDFHADACTGDSGGPATIR